MPKTARPLPAPLARGARRFAQWRRKRTTRSIPNQLWSLASRLGAQHGVSRTSRALGVEYYELKKRVEAAGTSSSWKAASPAFVEIPTSPPRSPSECLVEFEDASGAKMRIQVMGGSTPDLAALLRLFLEQRA
jgi:hypothetical protein